MPLNLGDYKGIGFNLISPYSLNGKTYYYVDTSGDGTNLGSDSVSFSSITEVFGPFNDSAYNKLIPLNGYSIRLPSRDELLAIFASSESDPPTGWSATNLQNWIPGSSVSGWVFWSSSNSQGQNVVNLLNGNWYNDYLDTLHQKNLIVELIDAVPNYELSISSNTVNEGSTAIFTLTTINVASGTSVPFTLAGISAADVSGGSLSGNAVVNSSGVATISVTLLNDLLTEGPETLVLTVNNISSSVVINDSSLSTGITISSTGATPTFNSSNGHYYEFVPGTVSWNQALISSRLASFNGLQGYLATITSIGENQFIGAMIGPDGDGYNISGLNDPSLNGYFWIGGSDRLLEGDWRWVDGPEAGQKFSTANQKMNGQFSNWFSIPTSVGEGVPNQAARDEDGLALDRSWNYTWYDLPIEDTNFPYGYGVKGYVVEYGGVIKDISLTPSNASVNEGATITFTATTANVASGTIISYTLSGVTSSDVFGGVLGLSLIHI